MTNSNEETEEAFTDTPDPYQARNGRREALQIALHLVDKTVDDAATLLGYAEQIDAYLEDGTTPESARREAARASTNPYVGGVSQGRAAYPSGAQSIHF